MENDTKHRENWQKEYSRRDQQWIHDKFISSGGLENFFPESIPFWLECGYRLSDFDRAFKEAKNVRMGIDELVRVADYHLEVARTKEEQGFLQSAFEYYHRASLCYTRGSWSILDADDEDKQDWHTRGLDAYRKVIELNPYYEIEKINIELPFHDQKMAAVFHKSGVDEAPTILRVPGMDMAKEETPNPSQNRFVDRGINVLTIDGPGQGETRLRGVCDSDYETYQKAGRAAIDWLVDRPEVDEKRIGVFGTSMGTYWGPRIAAEDNRVSALSTHMGCWYSKDHLFNQAQPFFKKRFMYMAGIYNEDEFDDYTAEMTLEGLESQIDIPVFITQGEYDELQVREQAKKFYEELPGPTILQLYENEFHPLGGVAPDVLCDTADWFKQVWTGDILDNRATLMEDYPNQSYIPSPKFEFLDQAEREE